MSNLLPIEGIIDLNKDNWNEYVTYNTKEAVLVTVWAPGLGRNDDLFQIIIDVYKLPKATSDLEVTLGSLNTAESKTNGGIAMSYDIDVSPTLLILRDSREEGRIDYGLTESEFRSKLEQFNVPIPE